MEKVNYVTMSNWLRLDDLRQYELYTELYVKYQKLQDVIEELTREEGK